MTRTGRPTKLIPLRHREIINALRLGYPLHTAAARVGIHRDTLQNWRRRGQEAFDTADETITTYIEKNEDGDDVERQAITYTAADPTEQIYLDLFVDSSRARSDAEGFYLGALRSAAREGDSRAAMFMLERSFGYHKRQEISFEGDVEIELSWGEFENGNGDNGDD